jgi:hypothetical protein
MTFKPPLTTEELRDIGQRKDAADIGRLLWEIKRLRSIALSANQVLRDAPMLSGPVGIVQKCLKDELAVEPVVMEMEKLRIDSNRK